MQQAGIGPDAVISRTLIDILEQQCPDGNAEPGLRRFGDFRRSVGGVDIVTGGQHEFAVLPAAATQFENACTLLQPRQECFQMRAIRRLSTRGVGRGVTRIKADCVVVPAGHRLNSATGSGPAIAAR